MQNGTLRLLIADDHPAFRAGVKALVAEVDSIEICGEAASEPEALQALRALEPDVLIADISLKGSNGLRLVERARGEMPELKILVCSMYAESAYGDRAILAGANGYVSKQEPAETLLEAIHQVASGDVHISASLYRKLLDRATSRLGNSVNHPEVSLSAREMEVFTLMGNGLSTKEIAQELCVSTKTVDTHREHLKQKLRVPDNNRLIRRAVEWVLEASA
jgi:DNA-binding NarL/FixJ family response regulator